MPMNRAEAATAEVRYISCSLQNNTKWIVDVWNHPRIRLARHCGVCLVKRGSSVFHIASRCNMYRLDKCMCYNQFTIGLMLHERIVHHGMPCKSDAGPSPVPLDLAKSQLGSAFVLRLWLRDCVNRLTYAVMKGIAILHGRNCRGAGGWHCSDRSPECPTASG